MTKTETLLALAARVEAGETGGPIEVRIFAALHPEYDLEERNAGELYLWKVDGRHECIMSDRTAPAITTSLDAITALTERVLGLRHSWTISTAQHKRDYPYRLADHTAHIWSPQKEIGWHGTSPSSPSAALLAALLRALAEKEKMGG